VVIDTVDKSQSEGMWLSTVFAIFMGVNIFLSALSAFSPGDQCIRMSAGKLTAGDWQVH